MMMMLMMMIAVAVVVTTMMTMFTIIIIIIIIFGIVASSSSSSASACSSLPPPRHHLHDHAVSEEVRRSPIQALCALQVHLMARASEFQAGKVEQGKIPTSNITKKKPIDVKGCRDLPGSFVQYRNRTRQYPVWKR